MSSAFQALAFTWLVFPLNVLITAPVVDWPFSVREPMAGGRRDVVVMVVLEVVVMWTGEGVSHITNACVCRQVLGVEIWQGFVIFALAALLVSHSPLSVHPPLSSRLSLRPSPFERLVRTHAVLFSIHM